MIQLATDPSASRTTYRLPVDGSKAQAAASPQRARSSHPWPFLSRQPILPSRGQSEKPASSDIGS